MSKQASKMDKAKAMLVLDHPFVASILLRHPIIERNDIQTLAVSNRGNIYYNAQFVESLTVKQLVWGLAHEVFHVICQHAVRLKDRKHRKWNYAGDAFINDTLDAAGIGERIPNTVDIPGSKDRTTDDIYNGLPDDDGGQDGSEPGGGGGGGGKQYMDGDAMGEDVIEEGGPLTEAEAKEAEAQIKVAVAQAAQAAKMRGKLPGVLAQFAADIIAVRTPWFDILERYMVARIRSDYTWLRPNRRFIDAGVYLPSHDTQPQMGEVVIQVDVSGSVSQQEIAHYNGHLSRIMALCRPAKVHVIYTDTQVLKHEEFGPDDEVQIKFYSGGGTHMPAGFDFVAKQGIDPEMFICLTDGYTGFDTAPAFPVIWCISTDITAPYGETVHFSMEEN